MTARLVASTWLRRAIALGVPLLAASCSPPGDAPARTSEPLNVVLICLDTVRADRLGCYGYRERPTTPALDALAARSVVFRNATASAGWTKPSVPSFFTGLYPVQHGVYEGSARSRDALTSDVLPERVETLAEAFRAAGFETAAFVHNAQLRAGLGFEQGFDVYADEAGDARDIRIAALDWLDDRRRDAPFLLYLHLLDAHWPYDIPDAYAALYADADASARFRGGDSRALRDAINDGTIVLEPEQLAALGALYDGALRYLDDELHRLFDGLQQRGLAGRTVIAVVADHGEEFLEHGRIGHGHGLWENLLRVPWILHVPGRPARVVDAEVNLVDLPATLMAACGVDLPRRAGDCVPFSESVDRLASPDRPMPIFAEHKSPDSYQQSLRVGTLKLVRRWTPPEANALPEAPEADTSPVAVGERWEAEVEVTAAGTLRAVQLKPRSEPVTEPLELKGHATDVGEDTFRIAGVLVLVGPETELSGDAAGQAAGLREGVPIKASGAVTDGTLLATRLKFYAPGEALGSEIRGTTTAVEAGVVRLGGLAVAVDQSTDWKDLPEDEDRAPALTREAVISALELRSMEAARQGWRIESALYDLARDVGEGSPAALAGPDVERLSALLDELGASLAQRRAWSPEDRAAVDTQSAEALRALGYVR